MYYGPVALYYEIKLCYVMLVFISSHVSFYKLTWAVAQGELDWKPRGRGFNPRHGRQHSFVEIDHEIFSTVILSLPLI